MATLQTPTAGNGVTWTANTTANINNTSGVANSIGGTTTTIYPNTWTINGGSGIYTTTSDYFTYSGYAGGDAFTLYLSALPEEELDKTLDIVKANTTKDEFKRIMSFAVSSRHFSEEFLLKYNEYLTKDCIMIKHNENIKSREYTSLALLLEEKETEK